METTPLQAAKILEKWRQHLLALENVVGVGYTHHASAEIGILGGKPGIVVYVERLTKALEKALPRVIDKVQVIVKEVGEVKLFSTTVQPLTVTDPRRVQRIRPVVGGVSCGSPDITAGTLTCSVYDKRTGKLVWLTDNHVIAQDWFQARRAYVGKLVLQPGPYDGGRFPNDIIGTLYRWKRVEAKGNFVDAAIAVPSSNDIVTREVMDIGEPGPLAVPEPGMRVKKSGRTTGLTVSEVEAVGATFMVKGWGKAEFIDQIVVKQPFGKPGDSGSYVSTDTEPPSTIGKMFAGSEKVALVNYAFHIERILGISFTPVPPPPAYTRAPAFLLASLPIIALTVKMLIWREKEI